jgi:hypothetical protein
VHGKEFCNIHKSQRKSITAVLFRLSGEFASRLLKILSKCLRNKVSIGLLRFLCFALAFFRVFLCIVEAVRFLS